MSSCQYFRSIGRRRSAITSPVRMRSAKTPGAPPQEDLVARSTPCPAQTKVASCGLCVAGHGPGARRR
jgi:hypothetical protein